jgi:hypothetical protein
LLAAMDLSILSPIANIKKMGTGALAGAGIFAGAAKFLFT